MTAELHAELRAELKEVREALAALKTTFMHLNNTGDVIRDAQGWGTFDTWFGGGLFSSWIKREKVRDADIRMRHLDESIALLKLELEDVGVQPLGGVGLSELTMTLDVWFDNLISDLMTQSRLRNAADRLNVVGTALVRVQSELGRREKALVEQLGA